MVVVTTVAVATLAKASQPATLVLLFSLCVLLLLFGLFELNIIIYDLSSYFAMKNEPTKMAIEKGLRQLKFSSLHSLRE